MKNDELLMKFFDGELTPEQEQEFNNLLNSDKSFKAEFDSMKELENSLKSIAPVFTLDDEGFLANSGDKFAKGKPNSSGKGAFHGTNNLMKIFLSSALIITAVVVLSIIGYNSYFADTKEQKNKIKTIRKSEDIIVENKLNEVKTESEKQTDANTLKEAAIKKDYKSEQSEANEKLLQSEDKTERIDGELQGTIRDENPVRNKEIIAQLHHELNDFHNSGDILNEVWTLKRLGIFYGQLNEYKKSYNYLNQALNLSARFQDAALKAEIYGELAYLNFRQGNASQAEIYKSQCLGILKKTKSKRTEYWIKKFNRF